MVKVGAGTGMRVEKMAERLPGIELCFSMCGIRITFK